MNLQKIIETVEKHKISVVCATCNKYWGAREQGLPEPKCLSKDNCSSPIGGGTFHEYEGPIPDFRVWCFVCGISSNKFIFIKGSVRLFSICDVHLEEARALVPIGKAAESLERYTLINGEVSPLVKTNTSLYKKQTFLELFNEVESYYAKKEGRQWIDV